MTKTELSYHLHLFHEGTDGRAYAFLGAHPDKKSVKGKRTEGVTFRVWAPDARAVGVVGDFNEWNPESHPCKKISVGVWERFIPGLATFDAYKFAVCGRDGVWREKSDPYAFHAETRPRTASKVYELDNAYAWGDQAWIDARGALYEKPVNILEVHLGSWRRGLQGEMLTYEQLAAELVPYVRDMGYTHIELMPVMEHPLDASWGYQVTGYFAATSRFGPPDGLMKLIDRCHQAGIGVILDWVPAHFPKDGHGLVWFDGGPCYEYADPGRREQADWGTLIFDYGRNEVRSFLLSSALFWLEMYHADGLRVDAVASMLYLDYGKSGGGWTPNIYGGRENLEAVSFLRKLSELAFAANPHVMLIAEESTAWPMVTKPAYVGGLGFNFKWNMGWMNDTLSYAKQDPVFRQYKHSQLTFSMMYAFSENYLLPISHDEVVHGKCSLIAKMPGFYTDKFAGVRVYLSYMAAHPGKKMLFMGCEFGQFIEWNFNQSLDWHLLGYDAHRQLHEYVKALNWFYRDNAPFWERDGGWDGFTWLDADDCQGNTLAFVRTDAGGGAIVCLFNFSPLNRPGYRIGVPAEGVYREILNSDALAFGGWGHTNDNDMPTGPVASHGQKQSIQLTLPPYGAVFVALS